MFARMLLFLILMGWMVVGCTTAASENTPASTPAGGAAVPEEPLIPTPEASKPAPDNSVDPSKLQLEEDVVFIFTRSGGLAGVDEVWTLYTDGRLLSKDEGDFQVSKDQALTLAAELERTGLFSASTPAGLKVECCDRFLYTLTFQTGGRAIQVQAVDGNSNIPHVVWDAINKVQEFIGTVKMNS